MNTLLCYWRPKISETMKLVDSAIYVEKLRPIYSQSLE